MTPDERLTRIEINFDTLSQLVIESKAQTESIQAQTEGSGLKPRAFKHKPVF
jgi:hypothetical protein